MLASRVLGLRSWRSRQPHLTEALLCSQFFMSLPGGGLRSEANDILHHDALDDHRIGRAGPSFAHQRRERKLEHHADIFVLYPVCIKGLGPYILRRDIMRLIDGFGVPYTHVRPEYDEGMKPCSWWISTGSRTAREEIIKTCHYIRVGGRSARLSRHFPRVMQQAIFMPLAQGSRERYALITDIQENATMEDILRMFRGFDLLGPTPVSIVREYGRFHRVVVGGEAERRAQEVLAGHTERVRAPDKPPLHPTQRPARHWAVIRFNSTEEARRAVRTKNNAFLHNTRIRMRILP